MPPRCSKNGAFQYSLARAVGADPERARGEHERQGGEEAQRARAKRADRRQHRAQDEDRARETIAAGTA